MSIKSGFRLAITLFAVIANRLTLKVMNLIKKLILTVSSIAVFATCSPKSCEQIIKENASYTVNGPIGIDTTLIGSKNQPFEEYKVRIHNLGEDIYIPTRLRNDVYAIGTFTGLKVLENGKLHVVGGTPDYFSETIRKLEKGRDYELFFYARQLDFLPDTVFVTFKYYLDSLTIQERYIEVGYTAYKPLYKSSR